MCAICGIVNLSDNLVIEKEILMSMLAVMEHRGPEGKDCFCNDKVGLGFDRLAFLDLSGGMQPISNENQTVWLVCNGEIFNYRELRVELIKKGHIFMTETDVETIIHLYEEKGIDFVKELNGQFAIALYDSNIKRTILARDQLGIAPLFYTVCNGKFVFGSEIKSIMEYPGIPRKLNLSALDQLLNYPGIVSPTTFFRGIESVKPGELISIHNGEISKSIYWDLEYSIDDEDKGEEYYKEEIRELLRSAIARRMVADVPVGVYISGGLDSSIVACYVNQMVNGRIHAFSADILAPGFSEGTYQKIVQDAVGFESHTVSVGIEEIVKNLEKVIWHTECAIKENYDVAAYMLSQTVAANNVKAVLTGQGSDEFFNGYVGYVSDDFRRMKKNTISDEERILNSRLWGDPLFRYERNHVETNSISCKLYNSAIRDTMHDFSALNNSPIDLQKVAGLGSRRRRSYIDNKLRLSDHLLGDHGDRMFFANSVEGRHPFLDKELISFVVHMPEKYKLRGTNEKYLLKEAAKDLIPDEIIRRKKYPFQMPGAASLIRKKSELTERFLCEDALLKTGIFDCDFVNSLILEVMCSEHQIAAAYEIDYLQIVLTTQILMEQYKLTL